MEEDAAKVCQRIESVRFSLNDVREDFCGQPADPLAETITGVPLCAEHLHDDIAADLS